MMQSNHVQHSTNGGTYMSKYLAAAMLTTALLTGAASAQTANKTDSATMMHREGEWRASKLVGVNVYNEANEKIGDISDVILGKSGKVENVVLGVGGFLGVGEHYVAVAYDKLKWVNEPASSTTASSTTSTATRPAANTDGTARTTATDGTARTTGTATTTADDRKAEGYWYPDHVVYNATKDQLKAMPQFKY
jgi:sporulation protein YlmC with PRC-barrel domain